MFKVCRQVTHNASFRHQSKLGAKSPYPLPWTHIGDVPAGDKMKVYLLEFVIMIEVKQKNTKSLNLLESQKSALVFYVT